LGDSFEKVGEINLEEDPQTPTEPVPSVPSDETLTSAELRKKRLKTLAGRTDLPWVRKMLAQRSKAPPASPQPSSQTSQPTRKSYWLAAQGFVRRSSTTKQGPSVIEEIESSPEGSPIKNPETPAAPQDSPVLDSEQESTETSPLSKQTPTSRPVLKRKATFKQGPTPKPFEEPSSKRVKTSVTPSPKLETFLKRGVVGGELVKIGYFREQGLDVFLGKLRAQGWLELFTNTQLGCSQPDLAEFYANISITKDRVTSTVNGVLIEFDAHTLGDILGVPAEGFNLYVREDKSLLGKGKLLELAQWLSQQPGLKQPQAMKKGDMLPLHQLLFWFIIKNIIPRGQGRDQADVMDQYLTDLMERREQINLSALMITHIARIANTTRAHDLGYRFLLTRVFEYFGVEL